MANSQGPVRASAFLDHAATTPVRPAARAALLEQLGQTGNASSLHTSGRRARRVVEESRETIAGRLNVRPSEVVFTSGGTESDNLAIKGLYWSARAADPARRVVLVSAIEHHAVLDPAQWLVGHEHAVLARIPVDSTGVIDLDAFEQLLARHSDTIALVSIMWANNETGAIQPLAHIARLCAEVGIPLHTDAVQAIGWMSTSDAWEIAPAAASISGHKFGAPIGVGALVVSGPRLEPLLHGGGQEVDVRSGTLATASIAALAAAYEQACVVRDEASRHISALRKRLIADIHAAIPGVSVNPVASEVLPGIANLSFPDCEADALLMLLDAAGVECSAGSACTAGVPRPSHVLLAMGVSEPVARGSLRLSLGWNSTDADVDAAVAALPEAVARAQNAVGKARARAAARAGAR
ncbi:MAG: cysteine desulfurase family protein [Candidatus Nanopelagicales bacterium]